MTKHDLLGSKKKGFKCSRCDALLPPAKNHPGYCRTCQAAYMRQYFERHPEKRNAYGRDRWAEKKRKFIKRHPEKHAAHRAVAEALRLGDLSKKPCERCDATTAHAHHEDYSKPLEVVWLCPACHTQRHTEIREAKRIFNAFPEARKEVRT